MTTLAQMDDEVVGKKPIGMCPLSQVWRQVHEQLLDDKTEARNEDEEDRQSRKLCPVEKGIPAPVLHAFWKNESDGRLCIECVIDSGAEESACPLGVVAHLEVEDSPVSKRCLHYRSGNQGGLTN